MTSRPRPHLATQADLDALSGAGIRWEIVDTDRERTTLRFGHQDLTTLAEVVAQTENLDRIANLEVRLDEMSTILEDEQRRHRNDQGAMRLELVKVRDRLDAALTLLTAHGIEIPKEAA